MRRVFDLDVLVCPRCGGRMSVIATIEAADVLQKILRHLGLPTDPPAVLPCAPAAIDARSVPASLISRLLRGVRAGVPARR